MDFYYIFKLLFFKNISFWWNSNLYKTPRDLGTYKLKLNEKIINDDQHSLLKWVEIILVFFCFNLVKKNKTQHVTTSGVTWSEVWGNLTGDETAFIDKYRELNAFRLEFSFINHNYDALWAKLPLAFVYATAYLSIDQVTPNWGNLIEASF